MCESSEWKNVVTLHSLQFETPPAPLPPHSLMMALHPLMSQTFQKETMLNYTITWR